MKKSVAFILAAALMLCMTGCANAPEEDYPNSSIPETQIQKKTSTEEITTSEVAAEPQEKPLSCDTLLAYAEDWAKEEDLGHDFISDIQTKPGETADETVTAFAFYGGFASASVSERNELVQTVMTTSLPGKIATVFPSNTSVENSQYAYVMCMNLLKLCELDKDLNWHETQLKNAPDEGDETMVIRSYTSNEWLYTAMIGEYFVTCVAARYCSQCKTNAPKVTFSPGSSICDNCNHPAQGGDGNTSVKGVTTQPYTATIDGVKDVIDLENSQSLGKVGNPGEQVTVTIVAEYTDENGALWGKLESGRGWVYLKAEKCSTCGKALTGYNWGLCRECELDLGV